MKQIINTFDKAIYNFIINLRNPVLTEILKVITKFGGIFSLFLITLVIVIILLVLKKRKFAIAISLNILISSLTYIILKNIFQRSRPPIDERLIEEVGFSFPSGHTTNNVAFYGFAIYLIYTNVKNKKIRNVLCCFLAFIPAVIAFSRIYLRVHYPSDVIAGCVLGIICVVVFVNFIYKKFDVFLK